AQRYLTASTGFLKALFILTHLTWKIVNSVHSPRNIYCDLMLLGLYNKATVEKQLYH
ncbi:hypothetical protein V1515DRAFT_540447, partial [Lipomyces mesembrius]